MENEGFSFLSRLQKQLKRAQRTPNTANILREPRLRNELLQTNQAALNQHALSFFKSRREATVSAAHTWEDTWYQRWEKAMSKDPAVFFFFFFSLLYIFRLFSFSSMCRTRIKTLKWELHQRGVMDAVGRFTDLALDTKRGYSFLIFTMTDFINYWTKAGRVY